MSGQAYMIGFYPEGTGAHVDESDLLDAVPPFNITKADTQDEWFQRLTQPFPIHILDTETNYLTQVYNPDACPFIQPFKIQGLINIDKNDTVLQPLFAEIQRKYPAFTKEEAHASKVNRYIDGWISAYLDGRPPNETLSQ